MLGHPEHVVFEDGRVAEGGQDGLVLALALGGEVWVGLRKVELDDCPLVLGLKGVWNLGEKAELVQLTVADELDLAKGVCPENAEKVVEHAGTLLVGKRIANAVANADEAWKVDIVLCHLGNDALGHGKDRALLVRDSLVVKPGACKAFVSNRAHVDARRHILLRLLCDVDVDDVACVLEEAVKVIDAALDVAAHNRVNVGVHGLVVQLSNRPGKVVLVGHAVCHRAVVVVLNQLDMAVLIQNCIGNDTPNIAIVENLCDFAGLDAVKLVLANFSEFVDGMLNLFDKRHHGNSTVDAAAIAVWEVDADVHAVHLVVGRLGHFANDAKVWSCAVVGGDGGAAWHEHTSSNHAVVRLDLVLEDAKPLALGDKGAVGEDHGAGRVVFPILELGVHAEERLLVGREMSLLLEHGGKADGLRRVPHDDEVDNRMHGVDGVLLGSASLVNWHAVGDKASKSKLVERVLVNVGAGVLHLERVAGVEIVCIGWEDCLGDAVSLFVHHPDAAVRVGDSAAQSSNALLVHVEEVRIVNVLDDLLAHGAHVHVRSGNLLVARDDDCGFAGKGANHAGNGDVRPRLLVVRSAELPMFDVGVRLRVLTHCPFHDLLQEVVVLGAQL